MRPRGGTRAVHSRSGYPSPMQEPQRVAPLYHVSRNSPFHKPMPTNTRLPVKAMATRLVTKIRIRPS